MSITNPVSDLINGFQDLIDVVPFLVQPFVVALAAAVPFVEGEIGAMLGVVGGLHPVLAGAAALTGNLLSVVVVVLLGVRARSAITSRVRGSAAAGEAKPLSKGRLRAQGWFARFGVPGVSLLGPLAIPTQFTSAMLVGAGVSARRVILWQAVAIALWTTVTAVSATLAIAVVT